MAYKAEINVDVRNLNKVSELETKLSSISRNVNALNRGAGGGGGRRGGGGGGGSEPNPLKEELALLKLQNTALGQSNRAIRVKNKLKEENFKLEDALSKLEDIGRGKDTRDIELLRKEVELRKKIVIEAEKTLATTVKTSEAASKIKDVRGLGPSSPVFGRPGQIGSAANMAAINQDPLTSVSPVQRKLQEMEKISARNKKQAELRRKKSLSIGQSNIRNLKIELSLEKQKAKAASRTADARKSQIQSPQGPFTRLSDRQSRDVTGKRTRLNNPLGGLATRLGATRGFDFGSAAISGGFPLLFGQGPGVAAAGALGGGIGGMFGQMGGFAGGIAATAAVQSIQNVINGIGELGQAMNRLNPNISAMSQAIGISGTMEEKRLQLIEKNQGKQAAFNAALEMMGDKIGADKAAELQKFGETFQELGNKVTLFFTKVQAKIAQLLNMALDKGADANLRGRARSLVAENPNNAAFRGVNKEIADLEKQRSGAGRKGAKDLTDRINALKAERLEIAESLILQKDKDKSRIETNKLITAGLGDLEKENELNRAIKAGKEEEFLIQQAIKDKAEEMGLVFKELEEGQQNRIKDGVILNKDLKEQAENAKLVRDAFKSVGDTIKNDITEGIKGLIKGTSTLADLASNLADRFLDMAINQAMFGNVGGGSVTGGLFKMLGFANGGIPPVGKPSIVGEKGPELFVPKSSGTIVPNNKLGGGGNTSVVVNVDASGSNVEGNEDQGRQLGRMIAAAIQSEIVKQKRPGGLL